MYKIITKVKNTDPIKELQQLSLQEGNTAITPDKYNVDETEGTPVLITWEDKPAGMAVLEPSWYTGDPEVAVRATRYHILKEYRNKQLGFVLLPELMKEATRLGYKVMWWSLEPSNVALNNAYQGKRKTIQKEKLWNNTYEEEFWKKIIYDKRFMFMVDKRAPHYLQNVYWVDLTRESMLWMPQKGMVGK
jgi:GNAT superfamily N-acetyltransferase|tara:strand:+ start:3283 stop:3852 length:570 start_codon:yes stop_codon:yes gene_type:complete